MTESIDSFQPYTQENIDAALRLWIRSSISLIDVRYRVLEPSDSLERYRLPTSMFLYAYGGHAEIRLDRIVYQTDRFVLFHGGKGTELSIYPGEERLPIYMALYKTEAPPFYKREIHRLMGQVNPFTQIYGFSPQNPLGLLEKFAGMYEQWQGESSSRQLAAQITLYQIAHESFRELGQSGLHYVQHNYVEMVKQYLEQHYREPISIQQLIQMLPVGRGPLVRLFKKSEGKSLQEYLNDIRLRQAKRYLVETSATLQEIATGCGFGEELNLIRMFKKKLSMTPSEYRTKMIAAANIYDIDNDSHHLYNERRLDDLAKSQGDGEFTMFGQVRNKQMILAAAMSLMLLLSACGTAPANTTNGAGAQNTPPAAAATQTPAAATKAEAAWPRTYVDATGAEVVIEKQPERIALTHFSTFEILYALGATPVAFLDVEEYLDRMSTLESLRGGDFIDLGSPPNLEKMIEAKPDLIIDNYGLGDIRAELEKIAPVVIPHDKTADFPSDAIREYAKIIGKEKEAEAFISNLKTKLNEAREQLVSVDDTVMIIGGNGKTVSIYGLGVTTPLYTAEGLGLNAPEDLPNTWWEESSLEALTVYNPDHIFMRTTQERFDQAIAELSKSAVWNSLNAVKNDQVYILEEAMFLSGPLGVQLLADYVVEKLVK